jgi:hypothetical protein
MVPTSTLAPITGQRRELRRFVITDKIMIHVVAFSTQPVVYLWRAANL